MGAQVSDNNIPHYINDPIINAATAPELKLNRPVINHWTAFLFVVIHFFFGLIILILCNVVSDLIKRSGGQIFTLQNYGYAVAVLFLISLRFTLIWFVRVYQHYAKSETRLRCCMTPSCSEYAVLAIKKYGAVIGSIKTFRRLLRCHPPGGVDYP
jgi:putative membrane protein insertion efficiency factor